MQTNNKLREALIKIRDLTDPCEGVTEIELIINDIATSALAAPPRNCDRFASAEEAWNAFDEWADSYRAQGKTEPLNEVGWLFAPATEKKGESDGSK